MSSKKERVTRDATEPSECWCGRLFCPLHLGSVIQPFAMNPSLCHKLGSQLPVSMHFQETCILIGPPQCIHVGKNYFNALRRLDFNDLASRWTPAQYEEFICAHLIAAARDVRPDIVRLLFQQIEGVRRLHRILLYCDKSHEDETFTKTALEWAVENNDRQEKEITS